ncbi:MAG: hypothetical protein ACYDAC_03680 [Candidatus Dormibacteria bacterium]
MRATAILAATTLLLTAAWPSVDAAAASSTVQLSAGALTVGTLADTTLPTTSVSAGSVSGPINGGTWSDTTGQGAGWHGTIALSTPFVDQAPWTQTSGTNTALASTASGAYSGTVGNALITVTVASLSTGTTTNVSWSDLEGGTTTKGSAACSNGQACAIASGITITFLAVTAYPVGAVYQARVGTFSSTALALDSGAGAAPAPTGTTVGGSNLPRFVNGGAVVAAGGAAQPFVSAALNSGMGTFSLACGVTVTWDPNGTWSGVSYIATAQYAIVAGP